MSSVLDDACVIVEVPVADAGDGELFGGSPSCRSVNVYALSVTSVAFTVPAPLVGVIDHLRQTGLVASTTV